MKDDFFRSKLSYGFLDESGILEKKSKEGNQFVICAIIVAHPSQISDVMKIARRKAQGKFKFHTIFHAYKENEGLIKLVLGELAKRNVEIVIGVWDKQKREKLDKNKLYIKLMVQTVVVIRNIYSRLDLVIHKRYTNPILQAQLHNAIIENLNSGFISISQLTEKQRKELELADAAAWAVFQKYNRGRSEFYQIIEKRVKKESRLTA